MGTVGSFKFNSVKTYIFDALTRCKRFSESLDVEAILCSKSWSVFNDSGNKEIYLFQRDGRLIISISGSVTDATWKYIPINQSILINTKNASYMLHPSFIDSVIFALQLDGTNQYSFMIDELQRDLFAPKSLSDIENYFERKRLQELKEEKQIQIQRSNERIIAHKRQEEFKEREAEEALIEEALNKNKVYQAVHILAWIIFFIAPILLVTLYVSSDEFQYHKLDMKVTNIAALACSGTILYIIIRFFILEPIKNKTIKRIK